MDTKKLRQKVLDLAIHGKLVKQDPNDEPASILLDRIRAEKARLVKEGKIKKSDLIEKPISEEEIPFEVPKGWEWVKIFQVGEIITGSTPPKDNNSYYEGDIPFYKPTDLEQGIKTITSRDSLSENGFSVSRQLPKDSVLVTCIGATIGKTGLIRKKGSCNQQINAIIPYNLVIAEYLYYLCISPYTQFEIRSRASATTLPILNKNKFSDIPIPLPPLAEQHRIVKAVDELFEQIDIIERSEKELEEAANKTRDKLLNLAIQGHLVPQDPNEEPASVLLERIRTEKARLVKEGKLKKKDLEEKPISPDEIPFDIPEGWVWCRLGDIFLHSSGKQLSASNKEGTLLQYITTSNLYWGRFELDNLKSMYYKDSELEKCTAIKGDLLVCEGGDIGRSAIWPYDYDICLQNHVHRLRPFDNEYTKYVYYIMMLYKSLDMIGGRGIAIQGLSASALKSIIIPLPPLSEQRRIVTKLEELLQEIDKLKV